MKITTLITICGRASGHAPLPSKTDPYWRPSRGSWLKEEEHCSTVCSADNVNTTQGVATSGTHLHVRVCSRWQDLHMTGWVSPADA